MLHEHTRTQIFLRNDKHFSPTADWHSDNLPFHITLLRWLRCKQDIAPKRTDGEADRPTDMVGDDVSNKSIIVWVTLMPWHSASPLPRDLGDDVKAGGSRTQKVSFKKMERYLEEISPSRHQLHHQSGSRLLLLASRGVKRVSPLKGGQSWITTS